MEYREKAQTLLKLEFLSKMFLGASSSREVKSKALERYIGSNPSLPREALEIKDLMKEKSIEEKIFSKGSPQSIIWDINFPAKLSLVISSEEVKHKNYVRYLFKYQYFN